MSVSAENVEELAQDVARVMTEAIAGPGWDALRPRFLAVAARHAGRLEETERRISLAAESEGAAVRAAEAQRWSGRLEADLDGDERIRLATREFLSAASGLNLVAAGLPAAMVGADGHVAAVGKDGSGATVGKDGNAAMVSAAAGATVHLTQTQTKKVRKIFAIPILGPFISTHPVVVAATTVVIVGGATAAGVIATHGGSSAPSAGQHVKIEANTPYDFSALPPKVAVTVSENDLTYMGKFEQEFAYNDISGNMAKFTGSGTPTAAQCKSDIVQQSGVDRSIGGALQVTEGETLCFVNGNGTFGDMKIVDALPSYLLIDAALLGNA